MTLFDDGTWPEEEADPELSEELDRRAWIAALGKRSDEMKRECLAAEADVSRAIARAQRARAEMLRVCDLLENLCKLHAMKRGK